MADYIIPEEPIYNESIRKLENTDPANAEQVFNPLLSKMIENTAAVKRQADGKADVGHNHDGIYANEVHNHDEAYDTKGAAATAQGASVPKERTINNKPLTENITLMASDVGAAVSNHEHSNYSTVTNLSNGIGLRSISNTGVGLATGELSFAIGAIRSLASSVYTGQTEASGNRSVAIGSSALASGYHSFAIGEGVKAEGHISFAFGFDVESLGFYSFGLGDHLVVQGMNQTVIGTYNKPSGSPNGTNSASDMFIVGSGNSSSRSNCLRVQKNGNVYSTGTYNTSGADYAELFEWEDGNSNNEDRRGLFVALKGTKISVAENGDNFIIGIISSNPAMIGNSHSETWKDMYLTDMWGNVLTEHKTIPARYEPIETTDMIENEDGTLTQTTKTEEILVCEEYEDDVPILNPEYNTDEKYIPRHKRQEWGIVGMLGQLILKDDGTCEVGGFCQCTNGGIGTRADKGYYVMERVEENYIRVIFK